MLQTVKHQQTLMEILPASSWSPPYYQTAILDLCNKYRQNALLMQELQQLIEAHPVVQTGEHFWRPISEHGNVFSLESVGVSRFNYVMAWSRILNNKEILCAINLHHQQQANVYVTIDHDLHSSGSKMKRLG